MKNDNASFFAPVDSSENTLPSQLKLLVHALPFRRCIYSYRFEKYLDCSI